MEPGYPEPLEHSFETGIISPQNVDIDKHEQVVLGGIFKHIPSVHVSRGIGRLWSFIHRSQEVSRPTEVQWELPQDRWNYHHRQDAFLQTILQQRAQDLGSRLYLWLKQYDLITQVDNGNDPSNSDSTTIKNNNSGANMTVQADLLLVTWDHPVIEAGNLGNSYSQRCQSYHLLNIYDQAQ